MSRRTSQYGEESPARIGILVAKPVELAAIWAVFFRDEEFYIPGRGANRRYSFTKVCARNGGSHLIVCGFLADMGTDSAAVAATRMCEHFPSVETIVMIGIAAGVPSPEHPTDHVRLGDVVACNQYGVVQYDNVKETSDQVIVRSPPRPPSPEMLEGARLLEAEAFAGLRPWDRILDAAVKRANVCRPPESTDILGSSLNPAVAIPQPFDPERYVGRPRVFIGSIASGNTLMKNPLRRDALRDRFSVKAIEMEGAGIADAAWTLSAEYFVVRGVSDYGDGNKNDVWQPYASFAAAAYTRSLLESMPGPTANPPSRIFRAIAAFTCILFGLLVVARAPWASPSVTVRSLSRLIVADTEEERPQVYVRSDLLPVNVYIDGIFYKKLESSAPATSIALPQGEHIVDAKWDHFNYEERISLRRAADRLIVRIPGRAPP